MDLTVLIDACRRYALDSEKSFHQLPGFSVFYRTAVTEFDAIVYQPVLCLILQGSKETSIGDQHLKLNAGDAVLVSHDLPVISAITKATPEEPYIAAILALDLSIIRSLYDRVGDASLNEEESRSLAAGPADPAWLDPVRRYIALIDSPLDACVLGTAIYREIHYRLLLSPLGGMLRNLLSVNSHASRVSKAILKIRSDYREPLSVPDLARTAGMSASSFHEHFKSVTGTTPLQYQKDLRLIEARGLLDGGSHSVATAAFAVGYESPTHFSRDYSRKFGLPPSKVGTVAASATL